MRRPVIGLLALAAGLGGAVVLSEAAAHRRPALRIGGLVWHAPAASPDVLTARLAGQWRRKGDGSGLIVTGKGEVWSDSGRMQGRAMPSRAGADFAFGDGTFLCAYRLDFQADDAADWRLVEQTARTPCPAGLFRRQAALSR